MDTKTRCCKTCNEEKPLTIKYFYKNRVRKDGTFSLRKICKQCKNSNPKYRKSAKRYAQSDRGKEVSRISMKIYNSKPINKERNRIRVRDFYRRKAAEKRANALLNQESSSIKYTCLCEA